jgi:hypothetical protein
MGIRGEIYSTKVQLDKRTYFFNVKENRMGDVYFNVVESKEQDNGQFERQSVIVFADDLSVFLQGFDEGLKAFEKAVKDKKKEKQRFKAQSFDAGGKAGDGKKFPAKKRGERDGRDSRASEDENLPPVSISPRGRKVVIRKKQKKG